MVPSIVFSIFFLSCTIKVSRQWKGIFFLAYPEWASLTRTSILSFQYQAAISTEVMTLQLAQRSQQHSYPAVSTLEVSMNAKHSGHMEMYKLFFMSVYMHARGKYLRNKQHDNMRMRKTMIISITVIKISNCQMDKIGLPGGEK